MSKPSSLQLTPNQQLAVSLRDRTILVSAAAGAGKTRVLVERLLSYVTDEKDPKNVDDFLLVTYTRAAAAEMRSRILKRVNELIEEYPEDDHLRKQPAKVLSAHIGTLHGFCLELVREFAPLTDLPIGSRVGDDTELSLIKQQVMDSLLDELFDIQAEQGDDSNISKFIKYCVTMRGDSRLSDIVMSAWEKLHIHHAPIEFYEVFIKGFVSHANTWEGLLLGQYESKLNNVESTLKSVISSITDPEIILKYLTVIQQELTCLQLIQTAFSKDWDSAVSQLQNTEIPSLIVRSKKIVELEEVSMLKSAHVGFKELIEELNDCFNRPSADTIEELLSVHPIILGMWEATQLFEEKYSSEKSKRKLLDFDDQLDITLKLLRKDDGTPSDIAASVSSRFTEIMVDEYQDINHKQDSIINLLSKNEKNLFYVGDVKQSIYRFQNADPNIFVSKYTRFQTYSEEANPRPCKILLSENFRSKPQILDGTNHVFQHLMTKTNSEIEYNDPLICGKPDDIGAIKYITVQIDNTFEDEAKLQAARVVASELKSMIDAGTAVPSDCTILLRSIKDSAYYYQKALTEAGIPVSTQTHLSDLFETIEVKAITSMLYVIDNPRQDIPLIAALRCPIFSFTSDDLAALRTIDQKKSLFECLLVDSNPKSVYFITQLDKWRLLASEWPVWRLVSHIINSTQLLSLCGGMAEQNLAAFCSISRMSPAVQISEFMVWLNRVLERSKFDVPSASPSGGSAQIMTIHKSKGLEFPVVVLADTDSAFFSQDLYERLLIHPEYGIGIKKRSKNSEFPTISHMAVSKKMMWEKLSEELRLLYVAMTRAKNTLVFVSSSKDEGFTFEAWMAELNARQDQTVILKNSSYSNWLSYAADIENWEFVTAYPPNININNELNLVPEDEIVSEKRSEYAHLRAIALPSKLTASELKGRFYDFEVMSDSPATSEAFDNDNFEIPDFHDLKQKKSLTAAEKGTALHLVMQCIELKSCVSLDGVKAELARLRHISTLSEEQYVCIEPKKILNFCQNPLGQRLLNASECHRECKFSILSKAGELLKGEPNDEEILLQGVVDCFFVEPDGVIIIDFKTDRISHGEEHLRAENYRLQLETYAHAVQAMTGKPVIEAWLYFFATDTAYKVDNESSHTEQNPLK